MVSLETISAVDRVLSLQLSLNHPHSMHVAKIRKKSFGTSMVSIAVRFNLRPALITKYLKMESRYKIGDNYSIKKSLIWLTSNL